MPPRFIAQFVKVFWEPFGSWMSARNIVDVRSRTLISCSPSDQRLGDLVHRKVRVRMSVGKSPPMSLARCVHNDGTALGTSGLV